MSERLTNTQMEGFLTDFAENSTIEILIEGSKEKNEIIQIAKARGINLKNNKDLSGMKCIYCFADRANKNGCILPENELLRALPSMVGKPINIGHQRQYVIGHILDYRYIQKDKKVIMYGALYSSNFVDEMKQAKKDLKVKKLNVSFEIWSPKDKRKYKPDGSYELFQQEIAGCAILFRDDEPAFDGAHVLALSKKLKQEQPELVYAKKYKEDELLICKDGKNILIKAETTTQQFTSSKIKCSNCTNEFEMGIEQINIKCPKCFAILNKEGVMIYPPQIKDFKILCPSCNVSNWLIVFKAEKNTKLKCLSCSKEYIATFAEKNEGSLLGKTRFIYTGSVSCHQCNTRIPIESISDINIREMKCPKCGLQFSVDNYKESYKKIARIEAIKINISEPVKSSIEGGQKMVDKKTEHDFLIATIEENKKVISERIEKVKAKTTPKSENIIEVEDAEAIQKGIERIELLQAKMLTTEQRKVIPDSLFAVVKTVKNKKTGKLRKIRTFPMQDQAHVRNALARLAQAPVKKTLQRLGISDDVVRAKILRRAKELKMTTLLNRYQKAMKKHQAKLRQVRKTAKEIKKLTSEKETILKAGVRKAVKQHIETKKALEKAMKQITKKLEKQIKFYKENAKKILERQSIIGTDNLTDEEIVNDDKFERAKLEIETARFKASKDTASEIVGSKIKVDSYYKKLRSEIDDVALGRNKKD